MAVNGEKVSPMDVSDTEQEEVVKSAETTTAEEEDALKEALDSVSVVASSAVSAASTTTVSVGGGMGPTPLFPLLLHLLAGLVMSVLNCWVSSSSSLVLRGLLRHPSSSLPPR